MHRQLIMFVELLITFQSLLLCGYLVPRRSGRGNWPLALMMLVLAIHMGSEFLQAWGVMRDGLTLVSLSGLLYGPLFFHFVRGARTPGHPGHYVPFIAGLAALLLGVLPNELLGGTICMSLGGYLAVTLTVPRDRERPWLVYPIGTMVAIYVLDVTSFVVTRADFGMVSAVLPVTLAMTLLLFVTSLVFAAMHSSSFFAAVAASVLPPKPELDDAESLQFSALVSLMRERRLYLDASLTLSSFADAAGVPERTVSSLVNRSEEQTFSSWVNRFRIEEAERRLLTTEDSILDVLLDSGFNSKSTFYAAFRQAKGVTPSAYRESGRPKT